MPHFIWLNFSPSSITSQMDGLLLVHNRIATYVDIKATFENMEGYSNVHNYSNVTWKVNQLPILASHNALKLANRKIAFIFVSAVRRPVGHWRKWPPPPIRARWCCDRATLAYQQFATNQGIPQRMQRFPCRRANGSVLHFCCAARERGQWRDGTFRGVKVPWQL